jgi:multiple sugar transport system substrate-binding protein
MKKKKMVSLAMAGTLALSTLLTGCGGEGEADQSAESAGSVAGEGSSAEQEPEGGAESDAGSGSGEKVTITYWHIFPEGDAFKPVHDELVKRFNESQDEIYVEDLGISFFDFLSKMDTAIPAGTGPDVAFMDLTESLRRAEAGVLVDLTPYIERDNYDMGQFYGWTQEIATYNDHWYGIPFAGGGRFLVYNKDMFEAAELDPEQPPRTLEELAEYADKLTKVKEDGEIEVLGFHPTLGNVSFRDYVLNRGSVFFTDDSKPVVNSGANLETIEWYVEMTNKYGAKQVQSLQAASSTTGIDPFLAGFVAMEVNVVDFYKKLSESDINYGVAPMPGLKEGENATQGGSFDLEIFDHGDQKKADAAWEFLKFMTSIESQQYWASENKWPSTNQAAMDSCTEFNEDPVWQVILEVMAQTKVTKYEPTAPNWWNLLAPELEAAQLEQKTPEQALNDAQQAIETAIENNAVLGN